MARNAYRNVENNKLPRRRLSGTLLFEIPVSLGSLLIREKTLFKECLSVKRFMKTPGFTADEKNISTGVMN